ncbi:MAG: hypothetical protein J2O46_08145 [Nocardioides sp.]|nr:hypothetical protein [Nocardioides sp.]
MTWEETHRRWRLIGRAEAVLRRDPLGPLPWDDELAAAFVSRVALAGFIEYRWRIRGQAQTDPRLSAEVRAELGRRYWHDLAGLPRWVAGAA